MLAKAMTYKYCFHKVAMGGAKAAIKLPFNVSPNVRATILRKFGEHIAPLINSKVYRPWTDMNCSADDIANIFQGAGVKNRPPLGNSAYFTALSTFASVLAAVEYYQFAPEQCQITIEGLGNVGKYLAIEIERWGGKLIGASTCIGATANLRGLNVKQIIETAEKHNDFWVKENGEWEKISKENLFSLPMNIHIPCARIHSLTEAVAKDLNCKIVVPAANVHCTPVGELRLMEKGIQLLPDFVTNSGGIIGPELSRLGISDDQIRRLFLVDFKEMIIRLLKLSDKTKKTPTSLASLESHKNFQKFWMSGREEKHNRGIIRALMQKVHIPKKFVLKKRESKVYSILRQRFT